MLHPPTHWNLRAAEETVLNKYVKNTKKSPDNYVYVCIGLYPL